MFKLVLFSFGVLVMEDVPVYTSLDQCQAAIEHIVRDGDANGGKMTEGIEQGIIKLDCMSVEDLRDYYIKQQQLKLLNKLVK